MGRRRRQRTESFRAGNSGAAAGHSGQFRSLFQGCQIGSMASSEAQKTSRFDAVCLPQTVQQRLIETFPNAFL